MALLAVGVVMGWADLAAAPPPSKPSKAQVCEAAKLTAVGDKAECLANEAAGEVLGRTPNIARCDAAFTKAFAKAEAKAGGACPTNGDTAAVEAQVDICVADIAAALSGTPAPPACQSFPATGQTTCYDSSGLPTTTCANNAGQDGNIRAGAVLSYTDNGDGTITDNNTGLMWEKKSADGTIHDQNTTYTWANAFAVHVAGLNAGSGFAGHTDWRLPNIKELQSIVNYENANPAVSPAFNTACVAACTVLSCSCTAGSSCWASSSYVLSYLFGPAFAWNVSFFDGSVNANNKSNVNFVRAVRGGL
jgi:hypothetical protein